MKFFMLINLELLAMPNSFLLIIAEYESFSPNKYENANYFSANKYENANYSWHFHIY